MSALPPKADMCGATSDVRFVPIADIPPYVGSPHSLSEALVCHLNDRRLPGAVEDGLVGPIGAYPDRKIACRRRKPVQFLVWTGRLVPEIDGQTAIGVVLQRLVFRAECVSLQRVRREEVFWIVHRQ